MDEGLGERKGYGGREKGERDDAIRAGGKEG